jgi:hypothetical protein
MDAYRFPQASGSNLEGRAFQLPGDLEGELNLLLVAFQQWHQQWVDTWLPLARLYAAHLPGLRTYELPVIQRLNLLARTWIDWSMRNGIQDAAVRSATITLYLDKESFRAALGIPNEVTIHILLVTRAGEVLWRSEGPYVAEKAAGLLAILQAHAPERTLPPLPARQHAAASVSSPNAAYV